MATQNNKIDTFKIEVTKIDEFKVSVDSEIWNEETLEDFRNTFWDLDGTEDVAKSLAEAVSRQGLEKFYEGFGIVKTFFSDGSIRNQFKKDEKGEWAIVNDEQYTKGISITVLSMDDEVETNVID